MDHFAFMRDAKPGDVYRVTRYMIGRLHTPVHDEKTEGQEAIVLGNHDSRGGRHTVSLRVLSSGRQLSHSYGDHCHQAFELVRKSDGSQVVPGVSYPFTEDELTDQRWVAFLERVKVHDYRHQGFSNAPTFLAWLYLKNESLFVLRRLPYLRRKDGSVNPEKVRKAFSELGLKVDDSAYDCPIAVPSEFAGHHIPGLPRVNWQEVADEFKA